MKILSESIFDNVLALLLFGPIVIAIVLLIFQVLRDFFFPSQQRQNECQQQAHYVNQQEQTNQEQERERQQREQQERERQCTDRATEFDIKSTWHTILGVSVNASAQEIKSAYRKRISEYHPDKVAHLGDKLKEVAIIESQKINAAYEYARSQGLV